jgi:hypothetical protein
MVNYKKNIDNILWDVIIVGGGPAGSMAAAAAGREGTKVLLIEAVGSLGGMGTNALVPAWCHFSDGEKMICRGLAEQVFFRARKEMTHVNSSQLDWVPIDSERLKRVYDELMTENNVNVLFHSRVAAVQTKPDRTIQSVLVANKSGLIAYSAKVFVDATGDGDLAAWAGAEYVKDDGVQAATLCFVLSSINEEAFMKHPGLYGGLASSPIHRIVSEKKYPMIDDLHFCVSHLGYGTLGFNAGHIPAIDATNPKAVSEAMVRGRAMADQYRRALAEYCPEIFKNAFLVNTASLLGVRESRRIVGDYILTAEDWLARRSFPDEIGRNSYFIDIHPRIGKDGREMPSRLKISEEEGRYKKGESHGIPYRCLTPKGMPNLLTAGRCVSSDAIAYGSLRVMPNCLVMGEAAGLAAAMTAKMDRIDVHVVDTMELRRRLRNYGAYLPQQANE